jgi:organic hydroperoxide reductase OsmC/OhrA
MSTITATARTIPDTGAAVVRAGSHTLVADRADGVAGGMGLGFNGAQLLAAAIGGCLANDVRVVAADEGVDLATVAIDVSVVVDGASALDGLRIVGADLQVALTAADGSDTSRVVERALELSAVLASVRAGFPVDVRTD